MNFKELVQNKWFLPIIYLLFSIFISLYIETIPDYIINLYDNSIFRLLVLLLITYITYYDPKLSIIITISFFFILININEKKFNNNINKFKNLLLINHNNHNNNDNLNDYQNEKFNYLNYEKFDNNIDVENFDNISDLNIINYNENFDNNYDSLD